MGAARVLLSLASALILGLVCSFVVAWAGVTYQYFIRAGNPRGYWGEDKCFYTGEGTLVCDRYRIAFPWCGNDPVPPASSWPPRFLQDQRDRTTGGRRIWDASLISAGWPTRCLVGGAAASSSTYFVFENETVAVTGSTDFEQYVDRTDFVDVRIEYEWNGRQAFVVDHRSRMTAQGFPQREALALPYYPLWAGLAVNTALYGGAWWIAIPARRGIRHAWRTRAGRCPVCGYDLSADPSSGCPECGRGLAAAVATV